jgi:hypothetical protein
MPAMRGKTTAIVPWIVLAYAARLPAAPMPIVTPHWSAAAASALRLRGAPTIAGMESANPVKHVFFLPVNHRATKVMLSHALRIVMRQSVSMLYFGAVAKTVFARIQIENVLIVLATVQGSVALTMMAMVTQI